MNLKVLPLTLILLLGIIVVSCSKDSSDELQEKANTFQTYLTNKHFVPVDFYSTQFIDYDQDDSVIKAEKDLTDYILPYLDDDTIIFQSNGDLVVDQGTKLYHPLAPEADLDTNFLRKWKIETAKAKNQVLFLYLDYVYDQRRYILDYFTETEILAHVSWGSGGDTATLYTRFVKK